MLKYKQKEI